MKKDQQLRHIHTRERVLTFRVTFDQLDQLKRSAKDKGTNVSTVIREALSKIGADR